MAITLVVVAELVGAGFAIGVAAAAPGFTPVVTVSVDGATGTWAPSQSAAEALEDALVTDTPTTSPDPTSDQTVVPITPVEPEATSTSTALGEDSTSPSEPKPTTRF